MNVLYFLLGMFFGANIGFMVLALMTAGGEKK